MSNLSSDLCVTCGNPSTAMLVITAKNDRGRWVDYQYCRACAKQNNDLADERAAEADRTAERAGV